MAQALDLDLARSLAIRASGLGLGPGDSFPRGHEGAAQALGHLAALQIDTISVVERAHHHILWSRVPGYSTASIGVLEAEPRRAIEYWSHAAAWIPLGDYRYCLPRMERIRRRGHEWFKVDAKVVRAVRARLKAEGPLRVKDFEKRPPGSRGWWDWKPSKLGLEYLFHCGEIASLGRTGFQKIYDLAERVLPPDLDLTMPTEEEMADYYLETAQRTLGVFRRRDLAYMRKDLTGGIGAALEARVGEGRLVELAIEGLDTKETWYASPSSLEAAAPAPKPRVLVLSPFDPLVIDRRRLKALFGFECMLECYLPASRRSFGYFALPILWRPGSGLPALVGRLDAKAHRAQGILELRRLEVSGIPARDRRSFTAAMRDDLARYATFNGCGSLSLSRLEAEDPALEAALKFALGSIQ